MTTLPGSLGVPDAGIRYVPISGISFKEPVFWVRVLRVLCSLLENAVILNKE